MSGDQEYNFETYKKPNVGRYDRSIYDKGRNRSSRGGSNYGGGRNHGGRHNRDGGSNFSGGSHFRGGSNFGGGRNYGGGPHNGVGSQFGGSRFSGPSRGPYGSKRFSGGGWRNDRGGQGQQWELSAGLRGPERPRHVPEPEHEPAPINWNDFEKITGRKVKSFSHKVSEISIRQGYGQNPHFKPIEQRFDNDGNLLPKAPPKLFPDGTKDINAPIRDKDRRHRDGHRDRDGRRIKSEHGRDRGHRSRRHHDSDGHRSSSSSSSSRQHGRYFSRDTDGGGDDEVERIPRTSASAQAVMDIDATDGADLDGDADFVSLDDGDSIHQKPPHDDGLPSSSPPRKRHRMESENADVSTTTDASLVRLEDYDRIKLEPGVHQYASSSPSSSITTAPPVPMMTDVPVQIKIELPRHDYIVIPENKNEELDLRADMKRAITGKNIEKMCGMFQMMLDLESLTSAAEDLGDIERRVRARVTSQYKLQKKETKISTRYDGLKGKNALRKKALQALVNENNKLIRDVDNLYKVKQEVRTETDDADKEISKKKADISKISEEYEQKKKDIATSNKRVTVKKERARDPNNVCSVERRAAAAQTQIQLQEIKNKKMEKEIRANNVKIERRKERLKFVRSKTVEKNRIKERMIERRKANTQRIKGDLEKHMQMQAGMKTTHFVRHDVIFEWSRICKLPIFSTENLILDEELRASWKFNHPIDNSYDFTFLTALNEAQTSVFVHRESDHHVAEKNFLPHEIPTGDGERNFVLELDFDVLREAYEELVMDERPYLAIVVTERDYATISTKRKKKKKTTSSSASSSSSSSSSMAMDLTGDSDDEPDNTPEEKSLGPGDWDDEIGHQVVLIIDIEAKVVLRYDSTGIAAPEMFQDVYDTVFKGYSFKNWTLRHQDAVVYNEITKTRESDLQCSHYVIEFLYRFGKIAEALIESDEKDKLTEHVLKRGGQMGRQCLQKILRPVQNDDGTWNMNRGDLV